MRVLQLGKYYAPYKGGMESHLSLLCQQLKDQVELEVIVSGSTARTTREVVAGVPVVRCAELGRVASTSLNPTLPLELSRRRYDLLHLHFPNPMGAVAYLASLKPAGHKLVITYHSDIVRQERLLKVYAPVMHQVMGRASAILCTSPEYLESSPTLQRFRERCRVVPLGIDLGQWVPAPEVERHAAALRERYPGRRILGVGRLIYYKGFEHLIRAMVKVDAQLLLVGDGPLRADLGALASRLGVAHRVHFLGEISEAPMAAYYRASDLFVLPSIARSEAFGMVQLEAMACGVPVVNTRLRSGVPYVSRDGETGLTVEPGDVGALAESINRLLGDEALRARFGAAARERVEREFTHSLMAERTLAVYREALGPS